MTALPEHPASYRLSLLALCGELVVAIDAMAIREVRRAAETSVRTGDRGMSVLDLGGEHLPGWDLGELIGVESIPSAWAIVDAPGVSRPIGLRLGRCVMVQSLPLCRPLPRGIFLARPHAIAAAFSAAQIPELAGHVSGIVIDLARLLGERELTAMARVKKEGRAATLEA